MRNLFCVFLVTYLVVGLNAETDSTTVSSSISTTSETTKSSPEPSTTLLSSSSEPTISSTELPKTTTTQSPTTTSSTPVPTTTSTTPVPTTPSSPPTTTPETTTKTSDTTTDTPKTSTEPPVTTPEPPVTTIAPIPVPEEGHWSVIDGNTTCIRAALKIRFKVSLPKVNDYIVLSPNASSEGSSCETSNVTQTLVLTDNEYTLTFTFEKDADNVFVKKTVFDFQLPELSDTVSNDTHMFNVKSGNSYMCKTSSDVKLGNVTMEVFSIQIQAFGSAGNSGFGTVEECVADNQVNDIVPIAVGVALLALVVVVLIAYLVGRRRSRQRGYQSV